MVKFYKCAGCGDINADMCGEEGCDCGAIYCEGCSMKQKLEYGMVDGELVECDECSDKIISDPELISWLLNKLHMTREQAVIDIKIEREEIK
jgi:hypothetical protein